MKIGFLLYNWDGPGGIESQARQLAHKLAARGESVTVVTTVPPRSYGRRGIDVTNVEVFRVPLTRSPFFEGIARALFASRGGVEVLNAVQFTCGVHAARIAQKTRVPVVLKFAGGGAYGDLRTLPALDAQGALKAELQRIDRYVFVSDEIREEAKAYGLEPARFATIRNGVDLERFRDPPPVEPFVWSRSPEPGPGILYVGRLSEEKRPGLLLDAFEIVARSVPRAHLIFVGSGPLQGELEARRRTLEKLGGQIHFLGQRADVPSLHRCARVYVLPSASEGSPNALLEALAAGTPVVATDIAGVREIARPEREALLVPPDDAESLARAIVRLLEDPALAQKLSAAGPARVREEWDLERVADRYKELFQACVRERASRGLELDWRLGARGRSVLALRALASRVLKRGAGTAK